MEPKWKTDADVIDTMEPTTFLNLLEDESLTFRVLRDAIHLTCTLHNADFQELEELHGAAMGSQLESEPILCWQILRITCTAIMTRKNWATNGFLQKTCMQC